MTFSLRRFLPGQEEVYRSIRLEALQAEPGVFGNSFATESAWDMQVWSDRLSNPLCACFGLYAGEELIGLTSIFCKPELPDEGYLSQSYIRREFRGRGLSRMLYETRLDWARQHNVRKLVVGHRVSNLASKAANQHFGFQYSHSEPRIWPDRGSEDMLYYVLHLNQPADLPNT